MEHLLTEIPGRTAKTQKEEFLYFSGTNYLGMGQLPEFQAFVKSGMKQFGLNFGGSRLSNVRFEIFEQAEGFLADIGQAEAALTLSSGSLAGQLVAKYFETIGELHYAPQSHPAIRNSNGAQYKSRKEWIETLVAFSHQSGPPIVAFSDAVDSLYVQLFDFSWLDQLGKERAIILVVDDSHTWGITGLEGGGTYTMLSLPQNVELLTLGSLGKAYGTPSGFVLGTKQRIKALWGSPFFGGASPTLPAFLFAMIQSKSLYRQQRARLFTLIKYFQQKIAPLDHFNYCNGYPVFHTSATQLAAFLLEQKVLISSFPYPSPDSDLVTRIVLNALHTQEDIDKLAKLVQHYFEQNKNQ